MNNVSIKEFKNAIDTMLNGYIDGVSYIPLSKNHAEDLTWFLSQAEEMMNLMDKGVLTI